MRGKGLILAAAALGLAAVGGAVLFLFGGNPGTSEVASPPPSQQAATLQGAVEAVVATQEPTAESRLAAVEGGAVFGRLVRGRPPVPVPGEVAISGAGVPSLSAKVGEDGRFRLEGLPRETWFTLTATSPGLLPGRFPGVLVGSRGRRDMGDLVLGPGLPLEVLVRDATDAPVAGASVAAVRTPAGSSDNDWIASQFRRGAPRPPEGTVTTDAAGRALFEALPPGGWNIIVAAEGFARGNGYADLGEGSAREPVRVILQRACALSGTVYGADGKPLAGVVVVASSASSGWWEGDLQSLESTSAADGAYALRGLAPGETSLSVFATPDLRIGVGTVKVPSVSRYDIRLAKGGTVTGKVLEDATGNPVGGAMVTASIWSQSAGEGQAAGRQWTGADGAFRIEGLPPGNFGGVQVSREGFLQWPDAKAKQPQIQQAFTDGSIREVEVRLRRGAAVRGRVADPAGIPVAGAEVQVQSFHQNFGIVQSPVAFSGADGTYRIEGASPGKSLATATLQGRHQPECPANSWEALQNGKVPESCAVEVPEEGEAVRDLVLAPGGTVEGVVAGVDGAPAPGLSVHVASKDGNASPGGTAGPTDAEGKFRITGVAPGDALVVNAWGGKGRHGTSDPFRLDEGGSAPGIRVTLKAAGSLAGQVRRADGRGTGGASLRLVHGVLEPEQPWNWEWQVRGAPVHPVGADGTFRIEALAAGKYTLLASADGAASVTAPAVEIAEGEAKEGVEIVLPEERTISGKVVDGDRNPLAGAALTVKEKPKSGRGMFWGGQQQAVEAVTGADGAFTLRGLGEGEYDVGASAPGLVPATATAKGGTADLVLVLQAGAVIAGLVVDEQDGRPLADVPVQASPTVQAGGMWQGKQGATGPDGTFRLDGLDPGKEYSVVAGTQWGESKSDHSPKTQSPVKAGTTDLRFSLARGLAIGGRVVDDRNQPVTGQLNVGVLGRNEDGTPDYSRQRWGMASGGDGKFRLTGLPPGTYDVTVQGMGGPGAGIAPTTVKAVPAGTEDLVVTIRPGLPIRGRIVDEQGDPVKGQGWLQIQPSGEGPGQSAGWGQIQPDGTFTTSPLDPTKTYDLSIGGIAGLMGGSAKGVVPGTENVVLRLTKGGTISGRVVDESGAAVGAGVPVYASAEGDPTPRGVGANSGAATKEDGTFTVAGLGEFRFRLSAGGGPSEFQRSRADDLAAPGATDVVLRVKPGVALSGRLVDSGGNAKKVQLLRAAAEGTKDPGSSSSQIGDDGSFSLKGLAPGKVRLRAWVGQSWVDCGLFDAPSEGVVVTVP